MHILIIHMSTFTYALLYFLTECMITEGLSLSKLNLKQAEILSHLSHALVYRFSALCPQLERSDPRD